MNVAEGFQDEISKIFDDFLSLMRDSRPRVIVDSKRHFGYCRFIIVYCTTISMIGISELWQHSKTAYFLRVPRSIIQSLTPYSTITTNTIV